MPTSWRLTKARWQAAAFDGEGARLHAGRWNSAGVAVIYTAESRSLAALELLVNLNRVERRSLPACVVFPVTFDESLVETQVAERLPPGWRDAPAPLVTREIGDRWVDEARSAVLRVPSAVTEGEWNFLLSPFHADFQRIEIGPAEPFRWDPRVAEP